MAPNELVVSDGAHSADVMKKVKGVGREEMPSTRSHYSSMMSAMAIYRQIQHGSYMD